MVELNNLNDVSIYIVPLIDPNISLTDISVESGFVNAYTEDIDRPYLEDKVFMLYDTSVNTVESMNRYLKFSKLDTLHHTKYIKIDKKHYILYCFNIIEYKKDIRSLKEIGKVIKPEAALEISRFWVSMTVPNLIHRLFLSSYAYGEGIKAITKPRDFLSYESGVL